jgi:hypothetical protein
MGTVEQATAAQIRNIEARTGVALEEMLVAIRGAGLAKHGEMLAWSKAQWALGHGDANLLARLARSGEPAPDHAPGPDDPLDEIYAGPKAALRPLHERLMAEIVPFGAFELAPKKGYVSLRRSRQFAMLGPKNSRQVQLGINLKEDVAHPLVTAEKPGGMCQWSALLERADQVDAELILVLRRAFDAAG